MSEVFPGPFRQILAELELLSHGKTQTWNKSALSADLDRTPQGETHPPHIEYRRRWLHSYSDTEREQIQREAKALLSEWKGHKRPVKEPEPAHIRRQEMLTKGEGWEPGEVAKYYKTTIREVLEIRKAAACEPLTGKPLEKPETKKETAIRLQKQGLRNSEIASATGMSKQSVSQMLRRAA